LFTGLIEAKGRMARQTPRGRAARLAIDAPFADELKRGESVAVDGVCLTVVGVRGGTFEVDAADRTMETTTLGLGAVGRSVNLERAARVGDRLGGHIVTGHVDGVATVVSVERTSNGVDLAIEIPAELAAYVAPRGSIALDGVSLTIADVRGTRVAVSLIPETLSATTASTYRAGTVVNLETDVLAKYQESISAARNGSESGAPPRSALTVERLRKLGFTE
jgi:riboflavin synthase alpha subunit